jgi:hypothetical protein
MSLPNPLIAQPGHPPQWGQATWYQFEDGTELPCIIYVVRNASPDGKYYNVAARVVYPEVQPSEGLPVSGGDEYRGWLYRVSDAKVVWIPCGPPWP